MALNVGVIGVGMIGQDHVRRLTHVLSGARVAAVADADPDRAKSVADGLPGCRVHRSGLDLAGDEGIDAVVVCSPGAAHPEPVLACIAAGKQVFCEKPLATTEEACDQIVDAEVAAGRRLVTVGFMRRRDAGYQEMKRVLNRGDIGTPLIMHSAHRNPSLPAGFTSEMILLDSCVHDIDIARWLLAAEVAAAQVLTPRRSSLATDGLQDPLILLLEMSSGALVDIEVLGNSGYGYDIRGEIVGERGTVNLAESAPVVVKRDGLYRGRVPADWRERFAHAYDAELQQWVDVAAGGAAAGPSSWDGYAATVAASAGVRALHAGSRAGVSLRPTPGLYRATS